MNNNNTLPRAIKSVMFNKALCGFYKSTNIVNDINKTTARYIYALPSIELCDSKRKDIHREFALIHSGEESAITAPVRDFVKAVNMCTAEGIITTHATLKTALFQGIELNDKYHLVIDELIDFHQHHYFKCTFETYQALRNYIDFVDYQFIDNDKSRYRVEICKHKINQVKRIIKNRDNEDALLTAKGVIEFLEYLLSASHDTYILAGVETRLDMLASNNETSCQFQALSVLNHNAFDQFESVTILSSLFDWSICYHLMQIFGFDFTDVTHNTQQYHDSTKAHITYYLDQNYTYTLRTTKDHLGNTVQSYIASAMLSKAAGDEYIYNANCAKKNETECPRSLLAGTRGHLVNTVHGHNDKDHITHCMWLSSQYARSDERNVLTAFGVPAWVVDFDRNQLNAYQHALRTALRDADNVEDVHLQVPDFATANFFFSLFPYSPEPVKASIPAVEAIIAKLKTEADERAEAERIEREQQEKPLTLRTDDENLYRKVDRTIKKIIAGESIKVGKAKELVEAYDKYNIEHDTHYNHCISVLTK